jgi:hypothetical protein
MAEDRLILLTNRGDGVDEIPNDELIEEDDVEQSGNSQVSFIWNLLMLVLIKLALPTKLALVGYII